MGGRRVRRRPLPVGPRRRRGAASTPARRCGCGPKYTLLRPAAKRLLPDAVAVGPPRRRRDDHASAAASGSPCTRPGHTPDHLCLFDPDGGVLLSGDHVLPTITPHISGVDAGPDPLAAFEASLDKVAAARAACATCCPPTATRSPTSPAGSTTSAATTTSGSSKLRAAPGRARRGVGAGAVAASCSGRGRGARWPRARPTPTSSTSASPARPTRREVADADDRGPLPLLADVSPDLGCSTARSSWRSGSQRDRQVPRSGADLVEDRMRRVLGDVARGACVRSCSDRCGGTRCWRSTRCCRPGGSADRRGRRRRSRSGRWSRDRGRARRPRACRPVSTAGARPSRCRRRRRRAGSST